MPQSRRPPKKPSPVPSLSVTSSYVEHFAAVYAYSDWREEARPIASHLHTMQPPSAPPHVRTHTICPLPRDACFPPSFEVPEPRVWFHVRRTVHGAAAGGGLAAEATCVVGVALLGMPRSGAWWCLDTCWPSVPYYWSYYTGIVMPQS